MAYLSPLPYRGTRDFYPEDMWVRNYIFDTWRRVTEQFGYEEYDAPLLEPFEIYAAKSGQDLVSNETYQFTDRGGRNVIIRPEMTPSISRMVAARRQEMTYPARLYSIAPFMRYERPQRGRERQFWQLNTDIFGVDSLQADAEIIALADSIMKAFGATNKMYTIKINSRPFINSIMNDFLQLDAIQAQLMIRLFDRKEKITQEEFDTQATEIFDTEKAREGIAKIRQLLRAETPAELPQELAESSALQEVKQLLGLLKEYGVTSLEFDIGLMRGFDYYTGIVFEVFDNHPDNRRAMFGGGRYDGLVGLFGVEPIATVGMAPGATTTEDFLRSHNLLPQFHATTEVYLIVLGDALRGAQKLASRLRSEGVKVAVDITDRKLDKQIKGAVKKQIPFILFVGEQELAEELYTLKDVSDAKEHKLSFEQLVITIKDYRHHSHDILDF